MTTLKQHQHCTAARQQLTTTSVNTLFIHFILTLTMTAAQLTTPIFVVTTISPPTENKFLTSLPPPLTTTTANNFLTSLPPPLTTTTANNFLTSLPPPLTTTAAITTRIITTIRNSPPTLDPDFNRCLRINTSSPTLRINSTQTREGSVIKASCKPPYYINSHIRSTSSADVFKCEGGLWRPVSPRCLVDNTGEGNRTGIIVACVIGILIGLALIIGAGYLIYKTLRHKEILKQKREEMQTKMFRINDFAVSSNRDFIGMPVVSAESRDSDLRGVPLEILDDRLEQSSAGSSPPIQSEEPLHLF